MIINNNFTLFQSQQLKPTFKADYFQPIKSLPNITCAYCGRKTLPIDRYIKCVSSISLPLRKQLEKGALNYLKKYFPTTWETIKKLSKFHPKQTLDEITHNRNAEVNSNYIELKEAVIEDVENNQEYNNLGQREKNRYINKIFFDLNDFARSYMKPSPKVIKELSPIATLLDGEKRKAFEQLKFYSKIHPEKTLSEIIKIPNIINLYRKRDALQKKEKIKKMDYHFRNILKIVEENEPNAFFAFQEFQKKAIKMLFSIRSVNKRKYLLEKMYKDALKEHSCKNIKEEDIIAELRQIPESFISKDSFFVEAANRKFTDIEIINALFGQILTSEKHIIPLDKGGIDNVGNKVVVCRCCNTKSKSSTYEDDIVYYPEIQKNTQKQMNYITSRLLKGQLNKELRNYPISATRNHKIASNNKLKLDITQYRKKSHY